MIVWRIREKIVRTVQCCMCATIVHIYEQFLVLTGVLLPADLI